MEAYVIILFQTCRKGKARRAMLNEAQSHPIPRQAETDLPPANTCVRSKRSTQTRAHHFRIRESSLGWRALHSQTVTLTLPGAQTPRWRSGIGPTSVTIARHPLFPRSYSPQKTNILLPQTLLYQDEHSRARLVEIKTRLSQTRQPPPFLPS